MDRLPALVLAALLTVAGCAAAPVGPTDTPTPIEPRVAGTFSTGGNCVDQPRVGLAVVTEQTDRIMTVRVAGNVTVPGANYAVDAISLTRVDEGSYRLDVNTTADTGKPARDCETGGIVRYETTVELPANPSFQLVVRHDGVPQASVGSGAES